MNNSKVLTTFKWCAVKSVVKSVKVKFCVNFDDWAWNSRQTL